MDAGVIVYFFLLEKTVWDGKNSSILHFGPISGTASKEVPWASQQQGP